MADHLGVAGVSLRVESRYWLVRMLLRFSWKVEQAQGEPGTKKSDLVSSAKEMSKEKGVNLTRFQRKTSKPASVTRQRTLKSCSQTARFCPFPHLYDRPGAGPAPVLADKQR